MPLDAFAPLYANQAIGLVRCTNAVQAGEDGRDMLHAGWNLGQARWPQVDFGTGAIGVEARVRIGSRSGWIELRRDSADGPLLGRLRVARRDVGDGWATVRTGIYGAVGVHDLVAVFADLDTRTICLGWLRFTAEPAWACEPWAPGCALPPAVPWLGAAESCFLGSGLAAAGGDADGTWDHLCGPDYTSESLIRHARIALRIDGVEHHLGTDLRRRRGTGLLASVREIDGLRTWMVDGAPHGQAHAVRWLRVMNPGSAPRSVAGVALVAPAVPMVQGWQNNPGAAGRSLDNQALILTQGGRRSAAVASAGAPILGVWNTGEPGLRIQTKPVEIPPGSDLVLGFYFATAADPASAEAAARAIPGRDPRADLAACLAEWAAWTARGRDLGFIADQRARDLVEGTAVSIRQQQGADGGIMATPRTYQTCYVRDTHAGLTGLLAAGHLDEARGFLVWLHGVFVRLQAAGKFAIPNAYGIGNETHFAGFGDADNWSSESPGLVLLTAENYLMAGGDPASLRAIDPLLDYAAQVQVDCAAKHGWKLPFNGDETDSFGSWIQLTDCGGHCDARSWSMPSVVIAIRSLSFYADYCTAAGRSERLPLFREAIAQLQAALDRDFWRDDLQIYDWYRGRDGAWPSLRLPNYHAFPLHFAPALTHPERAVASARHARQFINARGFIANQPNGNNPDFCGHNLGYLLSSMVRLGDPLADRVHRTLVEGGTAGCWGTWSESYYADGVNYGRSETWDDREHNLRQFESGVNIAAIVAYWEARKAG